MHEGKNAVFQGSDGVEFFRKFKASCGLMAVLRLSRYLGTYTKEKALTNDNYLTIICQSF